ncbi:hypothetical protein BGZ82_005879 [Podila clonocystis]|nr:hypothetical protein BGZ82_005879 [Podila clonocystis]
MGSTRSPHSSPLDSHSPYTQSAASKRKSSRSDYDDHSHNNSHEYGHSHNNSDDDNEHQRRRSSSGSSKKKKKSKREKERHHDRHYNDSDSDSQYGARSSTTTNVSEPIQKLPPIKISLRLPALSSIVTSSSSPSSASHKGSSRKKTRTDYDSEDDQLRRRLETREYSDPEPEAPSSSSHKKKKKKHKHKHRHPNHDDEDDVGHDRRDSRREHPHHYQDTAGNYEEDYEQDEDTYEAGTRQPSASKLTLRLGKTDKDSHGKERRLSKKSHRGHPSEENHAFASSPQIQNQPELRSPPPPQRQSSPPLQPTPVHAHRRSLSQTSSRNPPLSPVEIKQDYQWPQPPPPAQSMEHIQVGQKRPFAVLQSQSQDFENEPEAEEEDLDDPLAGELDEPEDYDEDEDDEEEDDNDGEDQQSDDNGTRSPSTPSSSQFGSKTVGGQLGSKTVPRSTSIPPKVRKSKTPKDAETREGSVTASSTTAKGKRKGKAAKRLMSPKSSTPAVPKKKELSAVCHKLLDQFIKKDMYVLFSQPVDPKLVPDYATVIKNPMDLSTMRAKVERNFYPTIDEFLSDFQLVCDNARLYNAKDTLYWKQADKLWEWGSKAIERDRKTVMDKDEEMLRAVKDEETLDIVGMGDYLSNVQVNRGSIMNIDKSVDSPMSVPETGRPHTPQQYRKSKKIKHRRDGTIALSYATDGSIDPRSHPDAWSLVPAGPEFGAQPAMTPITRSNGDYSALYLDDYPYSSTPRSTYRPSQFQDFGPFALLETPQESGNNSGLEQIPAYTGMIFGDAKGEALVKSLIRFMDPIMEGQSTSSGDALPGVLAVQEYVQKKVERLTRGASTIVDKVATVVREEKSGRPSGADTMVSISLWNQDFVKAKTDDKEQEKPEETKGAIKRESKGTAKTESESQVQVKQEDEEAVVIDQEAEPDVVEESPAKTADDIEMSSSEMPTSPVKEQEEMIDIRQVIQDIKVWPLIQRKRADYLAWRQLKIELDSLLPASQSVTDKTQPPPSSADNSDDNIKILWGVKWTGGDSEENKKWVREYLETNSAEMIQIVRILSDKARPVGSVPLTPTETTANAVASPASLSEEERTLVEMMTKSIRKRLAEMAQYVPLSEINPKNLPPPTAPAPAQTVTPTPPAAASATTPPTAGSSSTPTPIAPATASALAPASEPPVTTDAARAGSFAPSEGSISSLSSPGSSP